MKWLGRHAYDVVFVAGVLTCGVGVYLEVGIGIALTVVGAVFAIVAGLKG